MNIATNSNISFGGTINMTKGMVCYKNKLSDNAIKELGTLGLEEARGNKDKLDGKPVLNTDNIKKISTYGISYYLPKCKEEVELRFNDMHLKQADFDSFLIAYNAAKDSNLHIDANS
ncbi:hypothetical protein IJ182_02290 [bacterium]|nr:hypothetical protein [bacterium]